jgi:hypothetical protein
MALLFSMKTSFAETNLISEDSTKLTSTLKDSTKFTSNSESEDQTPMPIVVKGCGELGDGEVYADYVFCPSCCLYEHPTWSSGSICRDKDCSDQSKFTPGGTCGGCVDIDDNPAWPGNPTAKKYIITVHSTGTILYVNSFTIDTTTDPEGTRIYYSE